MSIFTPAASKSAKFANPGDEVHGTITDISEPMQTTKFGSQEPDFWPSGDPKMQVKITLQTEQREDADDDGKRGLWVTVSGKPGGQLASIRDAVRASGANDIAVGGVLSMKFTGYDPESKNPHQPRKLFTAAYSPATGGGAFRAEPQAERPVQTIDPMTGEVRGAGPVQTQADPWSVPAATPAPAPQQQSVDAARVQQMIALGADDNAIASATGANWQQINAIRNMPQG